MARTTTPEGRAQARRRVGIAGLGAAGAVAGAVAFALLLEVSPLSAHTTAAGSAAHPTRVHGARVEAARAQPPSRAPQHRAPVTTRDSRVREPAPGTHLMVDLASAPSLRVVRRWQQASPYRAIGVYVPVARAVDDRHDKVQRHLTPQWVARVRAGGWRVLPIYLGLQAPARCQRAAFHRMSAKPLAALRQGVSAAEDAAESTDRLGLASVPVMYDMEHYEPGCAAAVRAFLLGWTSRLHQLGRLAGVYGAPSSLGRDLVHGSPAYARPDVFWSVTVDGSASTAVRALPRHAWRGRRGNQFALDVTRRYGGTRLHVDDSAVDDTVWALAAPHQPDATPPVLTFASSAAVVRRKAATLRWAALDQLSATATYQTRVRRAVGGRAVGGWSTPAPGTRRLVLRLRQGEQVCVRVRARDQAGNASRWSARRCTSRLADDRQARIVSRWHRARAHGAYRGTLTTAARRHAVLRLGHASPGRLAVVLRGRGAVAVDVGGRRVGVLRGPGQRTIALRRAGALRLVTTSARRVSLDGFVLAPR
jgi:hypothetical protein